MEKITLRVQKAMVRDIGRNLIRIDSDAMEKLNIQTGDVIEVVGKKQSAGFAWPSYPQDNGLGIVRIDSRLQKNTGTRINDTLEIRKVKAEPAQKVTLAPILEKIGFERIFRFERLIKRKLRNYPTTLDSKLRNYPITIDDYIFISLGTRDIAFRVMSLTPDGVCIFKKETVLQFSPFITEFDFLTNNQLKNLEEFLEKCDYSKAELVSEIEKEFILENEDDLIRDSQVRIKHVIEYLLQENNLDWLISKIALDLYNKYEKTISLGQAEAILKRILDIKLSSTGRTQLYELRKKIRRYENFLAHFGDLDKIYEFFFKIVIFGLSSEQAPKLFSMPSISGSKGTRMSVGVEFYSNTIEISDKKVKLQLWDISKETEFKSLIQRYCYGASGAIIVYDKSDRESFKLVKEFYYELKEATNLKFSISEKRNVLADMPIILIGLGDSKNVTAEEGKSLANELGAYGYIGISETDAENFENTLASLSLGIITNYQNALKRSPKRKFRFKITVVGDGGVGKTSLIKKFTQGSFRKDYVKTIGAQFSPHDKELEGDKIRCLFWDIAGSDSFHFLRESFFKNSKAAIIVYSLGDEEHDRDSLNHISDWYEDIIKWCGDIPIIIIGNRVDLVDETKLDNSKIQEFVNKNRLLGYYLTSAKTGQGINEAFNKIIEELYNFFRILSGT